MNRHLARPGLAEIGDRPLPHIVQNARIRPARQIEHQRARLRQIHKTHDVGGRVVRRHQSEFVWIGTVDHDVHVASAKGFFMRMLEAHK